MLQYSCVVLGLVCVEFVGVVKGSGCNVGVGEWFVVDGEYEESV